MTEDDALRPFLPTLDAVRANTELASQLPPEEPSHVYGAAAIVVQIDGLRREAWTDDVELSEPLFEAYPKGFPPAPDRNNWGSYKLIDDEAPARRQQCMTCVLRPGYSPCISCGGTGMVGEFNACTCTGGFAPCTTCDGTRVSVSARIRYVNDSPVHLRHLFVPQLPKSMRSRLERAIDPAAQWPEALRFDPEPTMVGTAYRGPSTVREPDFHGFFFGDALGAATRSIATSTREVVSLDVRSYGVAILWLVYERVGTTGHLGFFIAADGTLTFVDST